LFDTALHSTFKVMVLTMKVITRFLMFMLLAFSSSFCENPTFFSGGLHYSYCFFSNLSVISSVFFYISLFSFSASFSLVSVIFKHYSLTFKLFFIQSLVYLCYYWFWLGFSFFMFPICLVCSFIYLLFLI
jgi:hypothetical protein